MLLLFDADLDFWMKPRSITWFSQFLLGKYDDRWIHLFRITNSATFALVELLKPAVARQNTKYQLAIPMVVRVACILFKITHDASLFVCSKMFAIGKSAVSLILRDVIFAINEALRQKIAWPCCDHLRQFQVDFFDLCRLLVVSGTIDRTHISICKPHVGVANYIYFKFGGYTINCQAVVDSKKRFLDLYLGMSGSTNDSRMLHVLLEQLREEVHRFLDILHQEGLEEPVDEDGDI